MIVVLLPLALDTSRNYMEAVGQWVQNSGYCALTTFCELQHTYTVHKWNTLTFRVL
jgi:hypothetical protein